MPEFDLNVERSRRIRKDIQGKSALHERAIEIILIEIVRCIAVAAVLHRAHYHSTKTRIETPKLPGAMDAKPLVHCIPFASSRIERGPRLFLRRRT